MKFPTTVFAVLLLMQNIARAEEPIAVILAPESQPARPNILFIVSDDHGWGDLPSNWDKTEVQLPTLEALRRSGRSLSELPHRPALRTITCLHVYGSVFIREWHVAWPRDNNRSDHLDIVGSNAT